MSTVVIPVDKLDHFMLSGEELAQAIVRANMHSGLVETLALDGITFLCNELIKVVEQEVRTQNMAAKK